MGKAPKQPKPPKASKGFSAPFNPDAPPKVKQPEAPPGAPQRSFLQRALDALAGAQLCYGEPVRTGDRTVIPVARVRIAGGGGWGSAAVQEEGSGGGGGGFVDAHPLGFVEIGPEGTRYVEIPDPERLQRTLKAGASAIATLAAGLAGARRLRGGSGRILRAGSGRRSRRQLGR